MAFIGAKPTNVPLTSSDITDGIITTTKIADGTIATADIADGAVTSVKTTGVGGDNTPMFLAYQSSDQSLATITTTRVVFDTEEFDDDNVFTNTSGNYKFTVPSAGKYWIYVSVSKNNFSGLAFEVLLKRTRSSTETVAMNCGAGGSGDSEEVAGNGKIFECQVGDEFHVTAKHEDSGTRSIFSGLNYTFFGAYKILE
jgi:hypothetical protein